MRDSRKYIFNSETLSYEEQIKSRRSRIVKYSCLFLASVAMTVLYVWIYTDVLGRIFPRLRDSRGSMMGGVRKWI